MRVGEVVVDDVGLVERVAGAKGDEPARFGPEQHRVDAEAVLQRNWQEHLFPCLKTKTLSRSYFLGGTLMTPTSRVSYLLALGSSAKGWLPSSSKLLDQSFPGVLVTTHS